jgi:hypothetical protein
MHEVMDIKQITTRLVMLVYLDDQFFDTFERRFSSDLVFIVGDNFWIFKGLGSATIVNSCSWEEEDGYVYKTYTCSTRCNFSLKDVEMTVEEFLQKLQQLGWQKSN